MSMPAILAISGLPLPLLVLGVAADHSHDSFTPDHLAVHTDLLYRGSDLHLRISFILPRDLSVSASSTRTRSPARRRGKCVRRRSATCARTFTPFSSSTQNMPSGRGSTTTPSTRSGGRGTNGDCTSSRRPSTFGRGGGR